MIKKKKKKKKKKEEKKVKGHFWKVFQLGVMKLFHIIHH